MVNFLRVKVGDSPSRPYPSHNIADDSESVPAGLFEAIAPGMRNMGRGA